MSKALVLGAGGSRGAFQVGCLHALNQASLLDQYDVVYGTSVGAFNAIFSVIGVQRLADYWMDIDSRADVLPKNWLVSLLWKDGLYNQDPLRRFLLDVLVDSADPFTKRIKVTAVEKASGYLSCVDSAIHSRLDIFEHILGSLAIPGIITSYNGLIDGAIREMNSIKRAIKDGYTKITVLANTPLGERVGPVKNYKLPILTSAMRAIEILEQEVFYDDYDISRYKCSNLDIKIIEPGFDTGDNLDFSPDRIRMLFERGKLHMQRAIKDVE